MTTSAPHPLIPKLSPELTRNAGRTKGNPLSRVDIHFSVSLRMSTIEARNVAKLMIEKFPGSSKSAIDPGTRRTSLVERDERDDPETIIHGSLSDELTTTAIILQSLNLGSIASHNYFVVEAVTFFN